MIRNDLALIIRYDYILICKFKYAVVNVLNGHSTSTGENREKDPPVLIPNTEVKFLIAEDSWLETARKNRTLPVHQTKQPHEVAFLFDAQNFALQNFLLP